MRGDGQVVVVRFDSCNVEVVPAFDLGSCQYLICNTAFAGSFKLTRPWAEVVRLDEVDKATNGNLRPLIRMLKAWQGNCTVPIKSFHLELAAANFLQQSPWRLKDGSWFDWMIRDFFAFLYSRAGTCVTVPGTEELVHLGRDWCSRCWSAYVRAVKACQFEELNMVEEAGWQWQMIFGRDIPKNV